MSSPFEIFEPNPISYQDYANPELGDMLTDFDPLDGYIEYDSLVSTRTNLLGAIHHVISLMGSVNVGCRFVYRQETGDLYWNTVKPDKPEADKKVAQQYADGMIHLKGAINMREPAEIDETDDILLAMDGECDANKVPILTRTRIKTARFTYALGRCANPTRIANLFSRDAISTPASDLHYDPGLWEQVSGKLRAFVEHTPDPTQPYAAEGKNWPQGMWSLAPGLFISNAGIHDKYPLGASDQKDMVILQVRDGSEYEDRLWKSESYARLLGAGTRVYVKNNQSFVIDNNAELAEEHNYKDRPRVPYILVPVSRVLSSESGELGWAA